MVRPASFGWNPQTAESNRFQAATPGAEDLQQRASAEFDALVAALVAAGVDVHVVDDRAEPCCPDAIFPNNWVSLHGDGTVVLYPMLAPNRRLERRPEIVSDLVGRNGFQVRRLLDLSYLEQSGRFLEGTGSVVFDHVSRVAYACRSPRSDMGVLEELCGELGYEACAFDAVGPDGTPVYHTNVMLSVGSRYALVADAALAASERGAIFERLAASGRCVVTIDIAQMAAFAGNALELRNRNGRSVLAISERGLLSLEPAQRASLTEDVDEVIAVPVPTIEDTGGGSVRCMIAEIFLPRS